MCSACRDRSRAHMQSIAPRSYLFVPGNRPDRYGKALAAGADAVIVDLEDAVPPSEKPAARTALAAWLSPEHPVLIRVNGAESQWFRDDLTVCKTPGIAGVLLPKAESVEDILAVAEHCGPVMPILALIETARGFWNAHALAQDPKVQRLVFGSIDFQLDLGIQGEEEELLYFRSQLVLVSRIAGLEPPVDGVTTAIDDVERVRAEAFRAKRLGFGAKLCIHPRQVGLVNECFEPTAEEESWARRIMEAAEAVHGAAVSVDGKMVDRPVIARAEAILERIKQRGRR
jgi:citrate lyase subunit beta/citryl-CoA lyase